MYRAADRLDQGWSDRSDLVVKVKLVSKILTGLTTSANTALSKEN